jgi:hypothetical protein
MTEDDLAELLTPLLKRLAKLVAQELQTTTSVFLDQSTSPLGPRRHIAAIRSGELAGVQNGRRYVALAADVDAYIRGSKSKRRAVAQADEVDQVAEELGLRKKAKGDRT